MSWRSEPVVFVGLGRMGLPMANALAKAAVVHRWSRSSEQPLDEAARGCSTAILMLTDAAAVDEVIFGRGLVSALAPGATIIDMGTTGVAHARNTAAQLGEHGIGYIDAPVSGGVAGASAATLTIFAGASAYNFERCAPLLRTMGRPTLMGPIGSGQAAKLANQVAVAIGIAALAESIRFAESLGLDPVCFTNALEGGFADSAIRRVHGPRMASREFGTNGPMRLHHKDLMLAASDSAAAFDNLALAPIVMARFAQLIEAGHGGVDHSGYFMSYDMPAGSSEPRQRKGREVERRS